MSRRACVIFADSKHTPASSSDLTRCWICGSGCCASFRKTGLSEFSWLTPLCRVPHPHKTSLPATSRLSRRPLTRSGTRRSITLDAPSLATLMPWRLPRASDGPFGPPTSSRRRSSASRIQLELMPSKTKSWPRASRMHKGPAQLCHRAHTAQLHVLRGHTSARGCEQHQPCVGLANRPWQVTRHASLPLVHKDCLAQLELAPCSPNEWCPGLSQKVPLARMQRAANSDLWGSLLWNLIFLSALLDKGRPLALFGVFCPHTSITPPSTQCPKCSLWVCARNLCVSMPSLRVWLDHILAQDLQRHSRSDTHLLYQTLPF